MSIKNTKPRRVAAAAALSAIVILLSRIPALYISPICGFVGKLILTACAVLILDDVGLPYGFVFAVLAPLLAWKTDVIEGQTAVAYGLATAAMMLVIKYAGIKDRLKIALSALAAAAILILYMAVLLAIRQEKTLPGAIYYSLSRYLVPGLAILAGAYLAYTLIKRRSLK